MITLVVEPHRFDAGDAGVGGGPASGRPPTRRGTKVRPSAAAASGIVDGGSGALAGAELVVDGDVYRHLFRARRVAVGERLRVVDGAGRARWGTVARVGRSAATVTLEGPAADNEPRLPVVLLVATPRPERAAWLVEKATEVGVVAIRFLQTERAPRDLGDGAVARLRRVAAAAVEQCHRSRCPEVTGPHPFAAVLRGGGLADGVGRRWWLDPAAAASAGDPGAGGGTARPADANGGAALLVGPEGGWAPGESAALRADGWQGVTLGERVLRIETAAVAGAALLLLTPTAGDGRGGCGAVDTCRGHTLESTNPDKETNQWTPPTRKALSPTSAGSG
jgi:16S rRNA (uracil1498-N3)-methyltransferase